MKQRFAATIPSDQLQKTDTLKYDDFIALISPKNRDFTELMLQRQADYELQQHENAYISNILENQQKATLLSATAAADYE